MTALHDGLVWGEALRLVGAALAAALLLSMSRDDRSHAVRSLALAASALFASSALLLFAWSLAGTIPGWAIAVIVALAAALAAIRAPYAVGGVRIAVIEPRRAAMIASGASLAVLAALLPSSSNPIVAIAAMAIVDAMALGALALTAVGLLSAWAPARGAMAATAFAAAGAALVPLAGAIAFDGGSRFWIAAGACRGVLEIALALTIALYRSELDRRREPPAVAPAGEPPRGSCRRRPCARVSRSRS